MKLVTTFLLLVSATAAFAQAPPKRPNFLFVYTDDQRWDAIGFIQKLQGEKARFPWLKTPNLDRLRAQGAHFSNAFCTTSLCSPGRAGFLTGQYAHTHGVTNNHTALPVGSTTYATLLQKAGYTTGFFGKWHMGNQPERPGFDVSASFNGQGKFYQCPVTLRKNGVQENVIADKWIDDFTTDHALEFLRDNKDKTFSLTVGFKSVHGPREPQTDFKDDYAGAQLGTVPNLAIGAPFRPEQVKPGRNAREGNVLNYFRTLTSVDRSLGRLLDGLDALGLDKNTLVIFTSDNGYYLGEHSLGDKRSAYEESLRLPFLIRSPFTNIQGKTIDSIVLNIDIAPTLLDFAGVAIPKEIDGHSLKPLLQDTPPVAWRTSFLYEYFYERNFRAPTIVGARTADAKIITYPGHPEWSEIYETAKDPYELQNQFNNPERAELKEKLLGELEKLKRETGYRVPSNVDKDEFGHEKNQPQPAADRES